jgi:hypothetical protein
VTPKYESFALAPHPRDWPGDLESHPWNVALAKAIEDWKPNRNDRKLLETALGVGNAAVQAALEDLGEPAAAGEDAVQESRLAERAIDGIIRFPGSTMSDGGSTIRLLKSLEWVRQLLSENQTSQSKVPIAGGARGVTVAVANAVEGLMNAMRPAVNHAEENFDWAGAMTVVKHRISKVDSAASILRDVVAAIPEFSTKPQWSEFPSDAAVTEVESRREFLTELLAREHPTLGVRGFWFGISFPIRDGFTTMDCYVAGASHYNPADDLWPESVDWEPSDSYLHSRILGQIYDVGYRKGGGMRHADLLGLAYTCTIATALIQAESGGKKAGGACGFDAGAFLHLGWL